MEEDDVGNLQMVVEGYRRGVVVHHDHKVVGRLVLGKDGTVVAAVAEEDRIYDLVELAAKDRQCVAAEAEMGIMDLGLMVLLVEVDVYGKALLSEAGEVLLLCYRD
ncbi:hypothetical protein F2P56_021581 [Juglans regia]|uniref:Uncharacterized protein n=1 Tax=Juglans regia TaxID=51240 RepID=A0A833X475_JUGRE|nr:hypothetical protein F2P56_021581 [Juglans regia]